MATWPILTGADGGLAREHALALARRGAKVVANDLGGAVGGGGGGASGASATDAAAVQAMVDDAVHRWRRADILVNNAGILRDMSFAKLALADFGTVIDVHLMGAVPCCEAVWNLRHDQHYVRIVLTTSFSAITGTSGSPTAAPPPRWCSSA